MTKISVRPDSSGQRGECRCRRQIRLTDPGAIQGRKFSAWPVVTGSTLSKIHSIALWRRPQSVSFSFVWAYSSRHAASAGERTADVILCGAPFFRIHSREAVAGGRPRRSGQNPPLSARRRTNHYILTLRRKAWNGRSRMMCCRQSTGATRRSRVCVPFAALTARADVKPGCRA
jgi:hypothetical protein